MPWLSLLVPGTGLAIPAVGTLRRAGEIHCGLRDPEIVAMPVDRMGSAGNEGGPAR